MQKIHNFDIWKSSLTVDADLIERIYHLKSIDEGKSKSNIGGWHSYTFTPYKDYYNGRYKWTSDLIESLSLIVLQHYPNVEFNRAWFNMSYPGGTNKWHSHGEHPVVSVFYVKTPTPCSCIEFKKDEQIFQYLPSAGDFLVFPGSLEHRVLENTSTEDRISFAINFNNKSVA